jgi:hypothetical protein
MVLQPTKLNLWLYCFFTQDDAKRIGALFDSEPKLWYCPIGLDLHAFSRWSVYIRCPYAEKDEAKSKGAHFDAEKKMWYTDPGADLSQFCKWLPPDCGVQKKSQAITKTKSKSKSKTAETSAQPTAFVAAAAPTINIVVTQPEPTKKKSHGSSAASTELAQMQSAVKEGCGYKINELKDLLKDRGVKGTGAMSKQELIDKCISLRLLSTVLVPSNSAVPAPAPKVTRKRKQRPDESQAPPPVVVPPDFECPISFDLMVDPVICSDGISYERNVIEKWLKEKKTSPKTNLPLKSKKLIPNITLRAAIETWREAHGMT